MRRFSLGAITAVLVPILQAREGTETAAIGRNRIRDEFDRAGEFPEVEETRTERRVRRGGGEKRLTIAKEEEEEAAGAATEYWRRFLSYDSSIPISSPSPPPNQPDCDIEVR